MENITNDESANITPVSKPKKTKIVILIIGVVIITAIIVGFAVYAWQNNENNNDDYSDKVVITPQQQDVQSIVSPTPIISPTKKPIVTGERLLLTRKNISQFIKPEEGSCHEKFNSDPPTTTVKYSNQTEGISFDVPYNPAWGGEKYRVSPFEEFADISGPHGVEYGLISAFEGCSWVRKYQINFLEPKSAQKYMDELRAETIYPELYSLKPTLIKINGLDVIKYDVGGLCDYPTFVVLGKKHNYQFVATCASEGEFEPLEKVVRTMKLSE